MSGEGLLRRVFRFKVGLSDKPISPIYGFPFCSYQSSKGALPLLRLRNTVCHVGTSKAHGTLILSLFLSLHTSFEMKISQRQGDCYAEPSHYSGGCLSMSQLFLPPKRRIRHFTNSDSNGPNLRQVHYYKMSTRLRPGSSIHLHGLPGHFVRDSKPALVYMSSTKIRVVAFFLLGASYVLLER